MSAGVDTFSLAVWIAIAAGVLAFLYTLATTVGNEKHLHELRMRVNSLRNQQFERLKRIQDERGGGGFDVVDEAAALDAHAKPEAKGRKAA
ncbi:MAG: hypothetical protein ACOYN0_14065 [Phycisphaerales bacterium]